MRFFPLLLLLLLATNHLYSYDLLLKKDTTTIFNLEAGRWATYWTFIEGVAEGQSSGDNRLVGVMNCTEGQAGLYVTESAPPQHLSTAPTFYYPSTQQSFFATSAQGNLNGKYFLSVYALTTSTIQLSFHTTVSCYSDCNMHGSCAYPDCSCEAGYSGAGCTTFTGDISSSGGSYMFDGRLLGSETATYNFHLTAASSPSSLTLQIAPSLTDGGTFVPYGSGTVTCGDWGEAAVSSAALQAVSSTTSSLMAADRTLTLMLPLVPADSHLQCVVNGNGDGGDFEFDMQVNVTALTAAAAACGGLYPCSNVGTCLNAAQECQCPTPIFANASGTCNMLPLNATSVNLTLSNFLVDSAANDGGLHLLWEGPSSEGLLLEIRVLSGLRGSLRLGDDSPIAFWSDSGFFLSRVSSLTWPLRLTAATPSLLTLQFRVISASLTFNTSSSTSPTSPTPFITCNCSLLQQALHSYAADSAVDQRNRTVTLGVALCASEACQLDLPGNVTLVVQAGSVSLPEIKRTLTVVEGPQQTATLPYPPTPLLEGYYPPSLRPSSLLLSTTEGTSSSSTGGGVSLQLTITLNATAAALIPCPLNCHGRGSCDFDSGTCSCHSGWSEQSATCGTPATNPPSPAAEAPLSTWLPASATPSSQHVLQFSLSTNDYSTIRIDVQQVGLGPPPDVWIGLDYLPTAEDATALIKGASGLCSLTLDANSSPRLVSGTWYVVLAGPTLSPPLSPDTLLQARLRLLPSSLCPGDCSGAGICQAGGVCACQPGMSGPTCNVYGQWWMPWVSFAGKLPLDGWMYIPLRVDPSWSDQANITAISLTGDVDLYIGLGTGKVDQSSAVVSSTSAHLDAVMLTPALLERGRNWVVGVYGYSAELSSFTLSLELRKISSCLRFCEGRGICPPAGSTCQCEDPYGGSYCGVSYRSASWSRPFAREVKITSTADDFYRLPPAAVYDGSILTLCVQRLKGIVGAKPVLLLSQRKFPSPTSYLLSSEDSEPSTSTPCLRLNLLEPGIADSLYDDALKGRLIVLVTAASDSTTTSMTVDLSLEMTGDPIASNCALYTDCAACLEQKAWCGWCGDTSKCTKGDKQGVLFGEACVAWYNEVCPLIDWNAQEWLMYGAIAFCLVACGIIVCLAVTGAIFSYVALFLCGKFGLFSSGTEFKFDLLDSNEDNESLIRQSDADSDLLEDGEDGICLQEIAVEGQDVEEEEEEFVEDNDNDHDHDHGKERMPASDSDRLIEANDVDDGEEEVPATLDSVSLTWDETLDALENEEESSLIQDFDRFTSLRKPSWE
jgi:hypothetical protein